MRYVAVSVTFASNGSIWAVQDTGLDGPGLTFVFIGTQAECETKADELNR